MYHASFARYQVYVLFVENEVKRTVSLKQYYLKQPDFKHLKEGFVFR